MLTLPLDWRSFWIVNRHSTVTHYQRPNMTHPQEGGTGGEVSEILFFSAKSKRRPSLIYSMQTIPVCLSIVARRKGVSATRRGGLNWTPISLLVGHPCKLFHILDAYARPPGPARPLVCLDETSKQLTRETRTPLPHGPGREARVDYEYERAGVPACLCSLCRW